MDQVMSAAALLSSIPATAAAAPCGNALVLADGLCPSIAELLAGVQAPAQTLAASRNPLAAITAQLQDRQLDTLHLVAHGRSGAFALGGQWIDAATLAANADLLAQWNVQRLALWSCSTGADADFIALLAELTGAEVFASRDVLRGGNTSGWELIGHGGSVQAPFSSEQIAGWEGNLDNDDVQFASINGAVSSSGNGQYLLTNTIYADLNGDGTITSSETISTSSITAYYFDPDPSSQWPNNTDISGTFYIYYSGSSDPIALTGVISRRSTNGSTFTGFQFFYTVGGSTYSLFLGVVNGPTFNTGDTVSTNSATVRKDYLDYVAQFPTISINNPISGDGFVNDVEDESPLTISGTTDAPNGQTVTVNVGGTVVTGLVTSGTWTVSLTSEQVKLLAQGKINVTASVANLTGFTAKATTSFIYDCTPPTLTINQPISGDGYVNNVEDESNLIISGTATGADGQTVSVNVGGIIATGIVSSGTWFVTLTPAEIKGLPEGPIPVTANVSDAAGNAAPEATASFIYDTVVTPPGGGDAVTLAAEDDKAPITGTIANNGVTNDETPTFSGVTEPGATVTVYDQNNTIIGSATAGEDGLWSFTSTVLLDGSYTFYAKAVDEAGNFADSAPLSFKIDTAITPPGGGDAVTLAAEDDKAPITGTIANNGVTNDETPTFSGVTEPGATVTVYDQNNTIIGSATAGEDGLWSFTSTVLLDGSYTFYAKAVDEAGNFADSAPLSFKIDTAITPPGGGDAVTLAAEDDKAPITGTIANNGATNDETPTFSGVTEPGATVTVYDQNNTIIGSATADEDGLWSFTSAVLLDGSYTFYAKAVDEAGNFADSAPLSFKIDTAITPPGGGDAVTLAAEDDKAPITGTIANNGATNDETPTFSGVTEPGATVTVYDQNNTIIGSATADEDGLWSFTSTVLLDGSYTFYAKAVDEAGNFADSAPLSFKIDTAITPPGGGDAVTLAAEDDKAPITGTIANNGVTNDETPTFSGVTEPGATVTVYDQNNTIIGSATAGEDGLWSFTSTVLLDGSYTFYAKAVDEAGNFADSAPLSFKIDTAITPPGGGDAVTLAAEDDKAPITGTIANNGATNDETPTFSGVTEPGATVTVYDQNNTIIGSATADEDGLWSFTSAVLLDGSYTFYAKAVDEAGNFADSAPLSFKIDTAITPPGGGDAVTLAAEDDKAPITGTIANNGATNDETPTFSGVTEPGATVTVYDQNNTIIGSATADEDGLWSFTSTVLLDGSYTFYAKAVDEAGNFADSAPLSFKIDTAITPPGGGDAVTLAAEDDKAPITGTIANNGVTNDETPTFSGVTEPGATVTVYDQNNTIIGSATAGEDGLWSFTSAVLLDGSYTFYAKAVDEAGNFADSAPLSFKIDTAITPPGGGDAVTLAAEDDKAPITGTIANNGATNDETPTFSGVTEPGATVTVYDQNNTIIGSATADEDGLWSFTSTVLLDGSYTFYAKAVDEAGNFADSAELTFAIDTVAPAAATITSVINDETNTDIANGSTTQDNTPKIVGTAEPLSTVEVFANGLPIGTAFTDEDGNWTLQLSEPLAEGTNTLTAVSTDKAGNSSLPSDPFTIVVDAIPDTEDPVTKARPSTNSDNLYLVPQYDDGALQDNHTASTTLRFQLSSDAGLPINGVRVVDGSGTTQLLKPPTPVEAGKGKQIYTFELNGLAKGNYTVQWTDGDLAFQETLTIDSQKHRTIRTHGSKKADALIGTSASEKLKAKKGDDLLNPIADRVVNGVFDSSIGDNTVDKLIGGKGRDIYQLGDSYGSYYVGDKAAGYAKLKTDKKDRLLLSGSQSDYTFAKAGKGKKKANVFYNDGSGGDLVAKVSGKLAKKLLKSPASYCTFTDNDPQPQPIAVFPSNSSLV